MTTLTLANPSAFLAPAAGAKGAGEAVQAAKDNCGPILRGIDSVIEFFTNWSLLDWFFEKLAGNFASVGNMQANWASAGQALQGVAANYTTLSGGVGSVWVAGAATRASGKLATTGGVHQEQSTACALISRQLGNMLKAAELALGIVGDALALLEEIVLLIAPGGLAKLATKIPTIVKWAKKIISTVGRIVDAIQKLAQIIPRIASTVTVLITVLSKFNIILNAAALIGNVEGGRKVDETAGAGF